MAGGGIGPGEADIWQRHILDSLMFARGIPTGVSSLLDLGSGVGLPGIPLALLLPGAVVTLVDRSRRRMELARRAGRILQLENLETICSDFADLEASADVVTMRAALGSKEALPVLLAHVRAGGSTILGVGIERSADLVGLQECFPGSSVLDPGRWLHIMRG
jgi:16S rRNA (guanine527-N7)-methyltransferase